MSTSETESSRSTTSDDTQEAPATTDTISSGITRGVQQIPATTIEAEHDPSAAVTREKLLVAIGREADYLAENRAGKASEALEELARAFAIVASSPTTIPIPSAGGTAPVPPITSRGDTWGLNDIEPEYR
ncbi:hypothetical protein NONI108955_20515 [Nocardia ninae]|uniref:Uncharacterized protein n=1 Tax=Nocardia ninae NBRC 108245 TaxID=1210091 RepID=A0A511MCM7_9NOCA|nr:hypothetical protein [Nocardia ninae]GEM38349.1 hypothetical protein NN4_28680 [Nocardia ninae NBRC 108245]